MGARSALAVLLALAATAASAQGLEKDVVETSAGKVEVTFVGHGSLFFTHAGKVIHVDPFARVGDYSTLPKADVVLITHSHGDHLDAAALAAIRTPQTQVVASPDCEGKVEGASILKNGERKAVAGVDVSAVPAYNLVNKRPDGTPFHPQAAATATC